MPTLCCASAAEDDIEDAYGQRHSPLIQSLAHAYIPQIDVSEFRRYTQLEEAFTWLSGSVIKLLFPRAKRFVHSDDDLELQAMLR